VSVCRCVHILSCFAHPGISSWKCGIVIVLPSHALTVIPHTMPLWWTWRQNGWQAPPHRACHDDTCKNCGDRSCGQSPTWENAKTGLSGTSQYSMNNWLNMDRLAPGHFSNPWEKCQNCWQPLLVPLQTWLRWQHCKSESKTHCASIYARIRNWLQGNILTDCETVHHPHHSFNPCMEQLGDLTNWHWWCIPQCLLSETIYMCQPKGEETPGREQHICVL